MFKAPLGYLGFLQVTPETLQGKPISVILLNP